MVVSCPNPRLASKDTSLLIVSMDVVDWARWGSDKPSRSHLIFGLEVLLHFLLIFIQTLLFQKPQHTLAHIPFSTTTTIISSWLATTTEGHWRGVFEAYLPRGFPFRKERVELHFATRKIFI
jgi:hypothetical protein